jgi:hypothetical protein
MGLKFLEYMIFKSWFSVWVWFMIVFFGLCLGVWWWSMWFTRKD